MGSLGAEDFYLHDNWPGSARSNAPVPPNGFDSTQAGNDATVAQYQPGTKVMAYQDSTVGAGGSNVANKGWYTMLYARYYSYEIAAGTDVSQTAIVVPACGSAKARGEIAVSRDLSGGNDCSASAPGGILCHSVGDGNYVWVLVGGIIPNYDVSGFDCTGFVTDGNVVAGGSFHVYDGDATLPTFQGGLADGTMFYLPAGFAWVDDT